MYYKSKTEFAYQVIIHTIVGIVALSALFPLIYVLGMSLTSQAELIRRNYFVIVPNNPVLVAYKRILGSPLIWKAFGISVFRSTVGPALMLIMTLTGAFVLSKKTLPGRKLFLIFVLATILFNGGLIPTYLVIKKLGLINSIWAMVIPPLVDSFGLLVIKIFIENLPNGLVESAELDGAGELQQLIWIVGPLAAPALAAIGMFNIVMHWNSWFDALIYISDKELYPLQMILRNMLTVDSMANDMMNFILKDTERVGTETIKMATVVVGILPMLCLYPFLQKHFIHGVYLGSIKG